MIIRDCEIYKRIRGGCLAHGRGRRSGPGEAGRASCASWRARSLAGRYGRRRASTSTGCWLTCRARTGGRWPSMPGTGLRTGCSVCSTTWRGTRPPPSAAVRDFVIAHLADEFAVAVFDESAQEKKGTLTAGVKRQYAGCVGKITNAINVVYCTYATPRGHAIAGAVPYLPQDWTDDPERRAQAGIDDAVTFRTKPQLALDLLTALHHAGKAPPWAAGDEVYGRDGALRGFCETARHRLRVRGRLLVSGPAHLRSQHPRRPRRQTAATRRVEPPQRRPRLQGRTPLRLGLAGHHQPTPPPARAPQPHATPPSWPTSTPGFPKADRSPCPPW